MRTRLVLLSSTGALLALIILAWLVLGPPADFPPPPLPPSNPGCPLVISFDLVPHAEGDSGSNTWLEASAKTPKIPFFAHFKNVSDRPILIDTGSYAAIDYNSALFSCDSWFFSEPKNIFMAITGELCWLCLKPGESITSPRDLGDHLNFTISGNYLINYTASIDGRFYPGPLPANPNEPGNKIDLPDYQKYSTGSFTASTSGQLKMRITPSQSSSGW